MNRKSIKRILIGLGVFVVWGFALMVALAQKPPTPEDLDAKVDKFLKENRSNWEDWNVPYQDGQVLYGKLVKGGCFSAHNVNHPFGGIKEFLDTIQGRPNYLTTIHTSGGAGISIS
jgi:hypothetical protein